MKGHYIFYGITRRQYLAKTKEKRDINNLQGGYKNE